MSKYRNTLNGRVVERSETYIAAYPEGRFVPVEDDVSVYVEPCCGANEEDDVEDIDIPAEGWEEKEND